MQTWSDADNTTNMDVADLADGGARKMQNSGGGDTLTLNVLVEGATSGSDAGYTDGMAVLLGAARSQYEDSIVHFEVYSRLVARESPSGTQAPFVLRLWAGLVRISAPYSGVTTGAKNDRATITITCESYGAITTLDA